MTPLGKYEKSNFSAGITFIISAGSAGEVGYSNVDFWAADDCFCIECSPELNSKYLYYVLKSRQDYLFSRVRRASVPRLSREVVEQCEIPMRTIEEQEYIVAILDKFTALIGDMKQGLPAEIAARRQQYEHYRNQLLTFKELTV
jgi:restriction endonuclease S subunit